MKKKLTLLVALVLMLPLCLAEDNYLEASINYYYGNLSVNYVKVKPIISQITFPEEGEYKAEILDYKNIELYSTNFDIMTTRGWDIYNFSQTFERNDFDFELRLPYFPEVKALNIYKEEVKLLSVDLSPYSSQEYFVKEGIVAEEKEAKKKLLGREVSEKEKKSGYFLILTAGLIILILIFFLFKIKKRKSV